ncbi:MAG: hypothetical protein F4X58_03305 [Chloroflexi bacterium]|nr:hypothetical protein [Chloroflexota bacterium]MYC00929.1 hypothetical protein [Chloroflexota bacterium]MYD55306.1 hypothetical protein [Chloroflexota bacterium]
MEDPSVIGAWLVLNGQGIGIFVFTALIVFGIPLASGVVGALTTRFLGYSGRIPGLVGFLVGVVLAAMGLIIFYLSYATE